MRLASVSISAGQKCLIWTRINTLPYAIPWRTKFHTDAHHTYEAAFRPFSLLLLLFAHAVGEYTSLIRLPAESESRGALSPRLFDFPNGRCKLWELAYNMGEFGEPQRSGRKKKRRRKLTAMLKQNSERCRSCVSSAQRKLLPKYVI